MAIEIERKFLVDGDFRPEATSRRLIKQGYLCAQPGKTIRVRRQDDRAFLTIKGPSDERGLSRKEYEGPIAVEEAEELFALCESGLIDKERFIVPFHGFQWEVDWFHGENEGLVIAEIELPDEETPFDRPAWLGREVSGDHRYYNAYLIHHPFREWGNPDIK